LDAAKIGKVAKAASACKVENAVIFVATAVPPRGYYGHPDGSSAGRNRDFQRFAMLGAESLRRWGMSFVWIMWIVWAVLVLTMGTLHLYSSRLSRDEDDQIYLDDAFSKEKAEQEAITAKVAKVNGPLRFFLWLSAAATVFVIVYYIMDIVKQFK
jgi:hypothetical protein